MPCSIAQLCRTLYDPIDYSPPGSSVHGISQAKILEWVPFPSPGQGGVIETQFFKAGALCDPLCLAK